MCIKTAAIIVNFSNSVSAVRTINTFGSIIILMNFKILNLEFLPVPRSFIQDNSKLKTVEQNTINDCVFKMGF